MVREQLGIFGQAVLDLAVIVNCFGEQQRSATCQRCLRATAGAASLPACLPAMHGMKLLYLNPDWHPHLPPPYLRFLSFFLSFLSFFLPPCRHAADLPASTATSWVGTNPTLSFPPFFLLAQACS